MLPNDLAAHAYAAMDGVFKAGHRVRERSGKNTQEWRGKSVRKHLTHAVAHIQHALGSEHRDTDLLACLDEQTKTADLANALLRIAMAIHLCHEGEQKQELRNMQEAANE